MTPHKLVDGMEVPLTDEEITEIEAQANSIEVMKQAKSEAVREIIDAKLSIGAPIDHEGTTLHVALDSSSRTDMTGMAATAGFAALGVMQWPEKYQQGWISIENVRIPLPTPADGQALAERVGPHYGAIIQNGRTLKDLVLAAADRAALDSIDVDSGWPD